MYRAPVGPHTDQDRGREFSRLTALALRMVASERGVSDAAMARAAGIHKVTMSHYMTGERDMPLSVLLACCEHVRVKPQMVVATAYGELRSSTDRAEPSDGPANASER